MFYEPGRGYGVGCLTKIAALALAEVALFLDGDSSDDTSEMTALFDPILAGQTGVVIGSCRQDACEPGH